MNSEMSEMESVAPFKKNTTPVPLGSGVRAALAALQAFIADKKNLLAIDSLAEMMATSYRAGGKIMFCGNGGSMCDAMHAAEELTGRFHRDRPALPAIAFSNQGHLTCVGNDYGFDAIFSRGVEAFAKPGDVLVGLTTSGNSANIMAAIDAAKARDVRTVALLGKDGGRLRGQCDLEIIVPGVTTDRIQELHMLILHCAIEGVEERVFFS
jgi:D-sedoheptulose 7-phosphate isomerase